MCIFSQDAGALAEFRNSFRGFYQGISKVAKGFYFMRIFYVYKSLFCLLSMESEKQSLGCGSVVAEVLSLQLT